MTALSLARWRQLLYSIFTFSEPAPTPTEQWLRDQHSRLQAQVSDIMARATALEYKDKNLDAFYVQTVGKALNDRIDTNAKSLGDRMDNLDARTEESYRRLNQDINEMLQRLDETNARIDRVLRQLRGLGETN